MTLHLNVTQTARVAAELDASLQREVALALKMRLKAAEQELAVADTLARNRLDAIGKLGGARDALQVALENSQQRSQQLESDVRSLEGACQRATDERKGLAAELIAIHDSIGWRWMMRGRALHRKLTQKIR